MTTSRPAGLELDAEVAVKIVGWRLTTPDESSFGQPYWTGATGGERNPPGLKHPPRFSTDMTLAWKVVERMRKHKFSIRHRFAFEEMPRAVSRRVAEDPYSGLSDGDLIQAAQAWFMAEPVDICLAALAALEPAS